MLSRKNIILASTALVGSLALSGCLGDGTNFVPPAEVEPLGAGGLVLGEAVTAMSADANRNLVRVSDQHSTVTLNEVTFDLEGQIETFNITFALPDGSTVTIDEGDVSVQGTMDMGDEGEGLRVIADNDDGDNVGILIGLGLGTDLGVDTEEDIADNALFALARIDRDGDHPLGHDTYMVVGDGTDSLPTEGTAVYRGVTIATLIKNGFEEQDHMTGSAKVTAHFLPESVDVVLKGEGGDYNYELFANDLAIDGSGYGGEIEGGLEAGWKDVDLSGDLLGAFFGDDAEATAGVFGATGTKGSIFSGDTDYELVGGYAGYVEDQNPVEE